MPRRLSKKTREALRDWLENAGQLLEDALMKLDDAGQGGSELYSKLWTVLSELEELTP